MMATPRSTTTRTAGHRGSSPILSSPADSWSSDWSDPRQTTAAPRSIPPTTPTSVSSSLSAEDDNVPQHTGIMVPSVLQPLLGLEFVPYLPRGEEQSEGEKVDGRATKDDASDGSKTAIKELAPGLELTETGEETRDLTERDPTPPPENSKKKGFRNLNKPFSSIGAKLRSIKGPRRKNSDSDSSLHRHAFHGEVTPRRKGTSGSASTVRKVVTEDWMGEHHTLIQQQQKRLSAIEAEAQEAQNRVASIEDRVGLIRQEVAQLQGALELALGEIQLELASLEPARQELKRLENEARRTIESLQESTASGSKPLTFLRRRSVTEDNEVARTSTANTGHVIPEGDTPASPRPRAHTEPRLMSRSSSLSYMRVSDLELCHEEEEEYFSAPSSLSSSSSHSCTPPPSTITPGSHMEEFFFIDDNLSLVLNRLFKLGFDVVTDESDRFEPTRETQRLLGRTNSYPTTDPIAGWTINPWHAATGRDVLMWTGSVTHNGFGHDWPVVKARGIVHTSSRHLLDFLLDSEQIKLYNQMSQGREDILILQEGVETTAAESEYGFAGDARIMRALNKPKLLPRTIELLSLWYVKQLENAPGSYMIVSRSVWEDDSGAHKSPNNNMLRSEMLLGVQLIRPIDDNKSSELTTITHVYSPKVPEMMAKRMAPSSAAHLMREIQALFQRC